MINKGRVCCYPDKRRQSLLFAACCRYQHIFFSLCQLRTGDWNLLWILMLSYTGLIKVTYGIKWILMSLKKFVLNSWIFSREELLADLRASSIADTMAFFPSFRQSLYSSAIRIHHISIVQNHTIWSPFLESLQKLSFHHRVHWPPATIASSGDSDFAPPA